MNWFGLFRRSHARDRAPRPDATPEPAPSAEPFLPELTVQPPPTPDEIRRLLFDAVAAGDERRLERLCQEHRDAILAHASGWLEVPAAFRASPEIYEWYGNGLRAIARFCEEKLRLPATDEVPSAEATVEASN
jgi:hypothetical protein